MVNQRKFSIRKLEDQQFKLRDFSKVRDKLFKEVVDPVTAPVPDQKNVGKATFQRERRDSETSDINMKLT